MKNTLHLLALLLIFSCSTDELIDEVTLDDLTDDIEVVLDNVIACAASNENNSLISVFVYPRDSATNIQYFETVSAEVDKDDFRNYKPVQYALKDVFNGYLLKFEISAATERWVIVSFDEDGKRHFSNPIRLKQDTKPTEYLPENVMVDSATVTPNFSWQDGIYDDTKIYFQVVSDANNNLLSGTYTFEKNFQFYELDNVVLNITERIPLPLKSGNGYEFTLLAVSEDNWVNQFSALPFTIE